MRLNFSTKTILVLACAAIVAVLLTHQSQVRAQGQEKKATPQASPTPIIPAAPVTVRALTKEENEKWTLLSQAEAVYNGTINRIVTEAYKVPVDKETSKDVHSAIKEAFSAYSLGITERKATLAQWRLDAECKDCVVLNGNLVRPAPAAVPAPAGQK